MKVLIIEDEILASKRLKELILEYDKSIKILDVLDSIEAVINWFKCNIKPDLIFMDIQLSDGLCFEIFNCIRIDCPVIFTTAFDEYAVRAFKVNSIDYLLKPINKKELEQAILKFEKMQEQYTRSDKVSDIQVVLQQMSQSKKVYRSRFMVKTGQTFIKIDLEKIAYFIVDKKLTFCVLFNNKKYILDCTLDEMEKELDPKFFFRINRQYILNINSVESAHIYFGGGLKVRLKPKTEEEVIVSRRRTSAFKDWMNK